jgi:head-tail adaptor
MDSGKLDTRVVVKRLTKTSDGYGGTTSTKATIATVWAKKKDIGGEFQVELGRRRMYNNIELILRKKTADTIDISDVLVIEGTSKEYRINEIYDSVHKYYTTIKATTDD